MDKTQHIFARFSQMTDADLKALPSTTGPVYSDADVTVIRNVTGDLNNAALTVLGQRAQPSQSNFLFNSNPIAQP
jgi:hypothetical protein